jgi:hypothetical protein
LACRTDEQSGQSITLSALSLTPSLREPCPYRTNRHTLFSYNDSTMARRRVRQGVFSAALQFLPTARPSRSSSAAYTQSTSNTPVAITYTVPQCSRLLFSCRVHCALPPGRQQVLDAARCCKHSESSPRSTRKITLIRYAWGCCREYRNSIEQIATRWGC